MSSRQFLPFWLSVFACAACNPFHSEPEVQPLVRDVSLNTRWHGNLTSPANLGAVQMNGSASMAPAIDGNTTITLDLVNASPGGLHPWAAHWGQCGSGMDSGVLGEPEAYLPLKVDSHGRATGTATVSLRTPRIGSYFVVVHASLANSGTVVACGNLAPPTQ